MLLQEELNVCDYTFELAKSFMTEVNLEQKEKWGVLEEEKAIVLPFREKNDEVY